MNASVHRAARWLNQHRVQVGVAVVIAVAVVAAVSTFAAPTTSKDFAYIEKPRPGWKVKSKFPITVSAKPKKGRKTFTVQVMIDQKTVITRTKKLEKPSDGKKKIRYHFKSTSHPAVKPGQHRIAVSMFGDGKRVAQAGGYTFTITSTAPNQPDDPGDEEEETDDPDVPDEEPVPDAPDPDLPEEPTLPDEPDTVDPGDGSDSPTDIFVDEPIVEVGPEPEPAPEPEPPAEEPPVEEPAPDEPTEEAPTPEPDEQIGDLEGFGDDAETPAPESDSSLSGAADAETNPEDLLGISPTPSPSVDVASSRGAVPVWQQFLLVLAILGAIGYLGYFGFKYWREHQV